MDRSWITDGECRNNVELADMMFDDEAQIRNIAKDVLCSECPVRYLCLQDALDFKERFGVRGGVDQSRIRLMQNINKEGHPLSRQISGVKCEYCGEWVSVSGVTEEVTCPSCDLTWTVHFK